MFLKKSKLPARNKEKRQRLDQPRQALEALQENGSFIFAVRAK